MTACGYPALKRLATLCPTAVSDPGDDSAWRPPGSMWISRSEATGNPVIPKGESAGVVPVWTTAQRSQSKRCASEW